MLASTPSASSGGSAPSDLPAPSPGGLGISMGRRNLHAQKLDTQNPWTRKNRDKAQLGNGQPFRRTGTASDSGASIVIMNDEPQTPEELDAHFGPDGPVAVAQRFFKALNRDRSLRAAYKVMTPELRLDRTHAWVELNAGHPELAKLDREVLAMSLADPEPDDPLWPAFEASSLRDFAAAYSFIDQYSYGYASRLRPIGVDQELVLLVKGGRNAPMDFDRPSLIPTSELRGQYGRDLPSVTPARAEPNFDTPTDRLSPHSATPSTSRVTPHEILARFRPGLRQVTGRLEMRFAPETLKRRTGHAALLLELDPPPQRGIELPTRRTPEACDG